MTITELSALQRITYLEYLAAEEKALSAISDDLDDQKMSAGLVSMSIRAGARLIALSLWHNDPKGPSEEELHQQVMSTAAGSDWQSGNADQAALRHAGAGCRRRAIHG